MLRATKLLGQRRICRVGESNTYTVPTATPPPSRVGRSRDVPFQADLARHARMPWLSAYMGHVNVLGTEVYLHATPELLEFASDRFAAQFASAGEPS